MAGTSSGLRRLQTRSLRSPRPGRCPLVSGKSPDGEGGDGARRSGVERQQPAGAGIGAGTEPVTRRGEPDPEIQVVETPPDEMGESLPVVVRDRKGDEQLGS